MRKLLVVVLALSLAGAAHAQCQPIGWVKVVDRPISLTERQCVYEKNGARVQIIVDGFCPMHPC